VKKGVASGNLYPPRPANAATPLKGELYEIVVGLAGTSAAEGGRYINGDVGRCSAQSLYLPLSK
jgi:hypothetical protein